MTEDSRKTKGEDRGHHQGARRVPGAAPSGGAPGTLLAALGGPPRPPFPFLVIPEASVTLIFYIFFLEFLEHF